MSPKRNVAGNQMASSIYSPYLPVKDQIAAFLKPNASELFRTSNVSDPDQKDPYRNSDEKQVQHGQFSGNHEGA
jgi:hypothetical protein